MTKIKYSPKKSIKILRLLGDTFLLWRRLKRRILYITMKPRFKACGERLNFCPEDSEFTYETISLGDDVHIGQKATFMSTESEILIGCQIMFGPKVTIIGGNHNTSMIGSFMYSVRDKQPGDDEPVIIDDDVWVGSNSTILKGVTIGRGSIVAAGSIVTSSFPPYAIIGGVPAILIRWRWPIEKVIEHEAKLYPLEKRIDPEQMKRERVDYERKTKSRDFHERVQ